MAYTLKGITGSTLARRSRPRPYCYLVLNEANEDVGIMRRVGAGWSLRIKGRLFTPAPESVAARIGVRAGPYRAFRTVTEARTFLKTLD